MKTIVITILVGILLPSQLRAGEAESLQPEAAAAGIGAAAAYRTALARADVAIARSLLNEKMLKGEFGETVRNQIHQQYFDQGAKWHNILPRSGSQGLDHVSILLDEQGLPRDLIVDETKFGSSRLIVTKPGEVQMGEKWISDRLSKLSKYYAVVGAQGDVTMGKMPAGISSKNVMKIPLNNEQSVAFWRQVGPGSGAWKYDGPAEALPRARQQLERFSNYLRAAAEGKFDFRKRLFQVKIEGNTMKVTVLDAKGVGTPGIGSSLSKLPPVKGGAFTIPMAKSVWATQAQATEIANELCRVQPRLDPVEAQQMAQTIQSTAQTAQEALVASPFKWHALREGAWAGTAGVLIAMPMEALFQYFGNSPMNWARVAEMGGLAGGSAAAGSLVGNTTSYLLQRTGLGSAATAKTARFLGLKSAGRLANLAGGVAGGGASAVLFAYGGYWLGYYDLQTANRSFVAGGIGAGAGVAASLAAMSLVAAYGTAGTGAAISTLSGAAAMNASLAWLGGGTLAGGGLGVAGGTVIASTGVGLIVVGATCAVHYVFKALDEHQECVRLEKTINYLSSKKSFFPEVSHTVPAL